MVDPSIFKAYDVRGIYPDQMDERLAYRIGRGGAPPAAAPPGAPGGPPPGGRS
jgi:phosphomannomutase